MSKPLTERVRDLFRPQLPLWACEFTSKHVIVAGVDSKRNRIENKVVSRLPDGALLPSLGEANIRDSAAIRSHVQETMRSAGFRGSEIVVVIPDEATRISFVTADSLPRDPGERQSFIRWKLKKTVPFDVDSAQLAFRDLGRHRNGGASAKSEAHDLLVALSPRKVVDEYETLMESIDLHAGFVVPSTLAALHLFTVPAGDALFVKIAPDCVTTTVFQEHRIKFYRRISAGALYEAVFPTVLYYQDKLGGRNLTELVICTYDEMRAAIGDLQDKLGITGKRLEPRDVEDLYKPALGAVNLSCTNSI
jgi:type IV pilus assembly protein PilM